MESIGIKFGNNFARSAFGRTDVSDGPPAGRRNSSDSSIAIVFVHIGNMNFGEWYFSSFGRPKCDQRATVDNCSRFANASTPWTAKLIDVRRSTFVFVRPQFLRVFAADSSRNVDVLTQRFMLFERPLAHVIRNWQTIIRQRHCSTSRECEQNKYRTFSDSREEELHAKEQRASECGFPIWCCPHLGGPH